MDINNTKKHCRKYMVLASSKCRPIALLITNLWRWIFDVRISFYRNHSGIHVIDIRLG